ncbi:hypothetical protein NJ959_16000 [Symplocastrum sp. BBK-W-15]|uniref:Uncharacterized protein n=1 Tax=Limnofasciculus baicalensis BBK-W-15 TaxID=2699891 RepID=A0AAE3GWM5_9CYAN|nr:hypothetical protein [Limnofasciculus baicalensis BBK-W-15]
MHHFSLDAPLQIKCDAFGGLRHRTPNHGTLLLDAMPLAGYAIPLAYETD